MSVCTTLQTTVAATHTRIKELIERLETMTKAGKAGKTAMEHTRDLAELKETSANLTSDIRELGKQRAAMETNKCEMPATKDWYGNVVHNPSGQSGKAAPKSPKKAAPKRPKKAAAGSITTADRKDQLLALQEADENTYITPAELASQLWLLVKQSKQTLKLESSGNQHSKVTVVYHDGGSVGVIFYRNLHAQFIAALKQRKYYCVTTDNDTGKELTCRLDRADDEDFSIIEGLHSKGTEFIRLVADTKTEAANIIQDLLPRYLANLPICRYSIMSKSVAIRCILHPAKAPTSKKHKPKASIVELGEEEEEEEEEEEGEKATTLKSKKDKDLIELALLGEEPKKKRPVIAPGEHDISVRDLVQLTLEQWDEVASVAIRQKSIKSTVKIDASECTITFHGVLPLAFMQTIARLRLACAEKGSTFRCAIEWPKPREATGPSKSAAKQKVVLSASNTDTCKLLFEQFLPLFVSALSGSKTDVVITAGETVTKKVLRDDAKLRASQPLETINNRQLWEAMSKKKGHSATFYGTNGRFLGRVYYRAKTKKMRFQENLHPGFIGKVKKLQFACENDGGAASCQRDAAAKKREGIAAGSHTVTLTVDSDDTAFGLLESYMSNLQALRSVAYGSQTKKTERAMTLGKEKKKVVAAKLLEVKFNKKQQQIIDDLKIGKLPYCGS